MHRIDEQRKKWLNLRARNSWRRRLLERHKRKLSRRREHATLVSAKYQAVRRGDDRPRPEIDAPADFSLTRNYDQVMNFFNGFRETALQRKTQLIVNLATIKSISPAAALVLAAEMDRWQITQKLNLRPVRLSTWDPEVRRRLLEMGFFEMLGVPVENEWGDIDGDDEVRIIRFMADESNEGEFADSLRTAIEAVAGTIIANKLMLYDGLTEAMGNAIDHAYPIDSKPSMPWVRRRWWMSGSYHPKRNLIRFMLYDQGVGIPGTLPAGKWSERIRRSLDNHKLPVNHHGGMIRAAMEISRSSTGKDGRGYGLGQMRRFAEQHAGAQLRILSGRGEYLYHQGSRERIFSRDIDFGGTLVQWEIGTIDAHEIGEVSS